MRTSVLGAAAVVALQLLTAAAGLSGQEVTYTGSLQLSSGDYFFEEQTTSLYLFNSLTLIPSDRQHHDQLNSQNESFIT